MLIAEQNPCKCGYHGDGSDRCICSPGDLANYRGHVSGPLLDRIDLHVSVPTVPFRELTENSAGERSADVRERVMRARDRQRLRFIRDTGIHCNGQMGPEQIRRHCHPTADIARLLQRAVDRLGLSARAYHRILKVSHTLADLDGSDAIRAAHAAEAIQYRPLDRGGS